MDAKIAGAQKCDRLSARLRPRESIPALFHHHLTAYQVQVDPSRILVLPSMGVFFLARGAQVWALGCSFFPVFALDALMSLVYSTVRRRRRGGNTPLPSGCIVSM